MTKFVVEITSLYRYLMEAETKEQAEELVWDKDIGVDFSDVVETTTSAVTKDEFDRQHPDSPLLFDLDLGRQAWYDLLKSRFEPK